MKLSVCVVGAFRSIPDGCSPGLFDPFAAEAHTTEDHQASTRGYLAPPRGTAAARPTVACLSRDTCAAGRRH